MDAIDLAASNYENQERLFDAIHSQQANHKGETLMIRVTTRDETQDIDGDEISIGSAALYVYKDGETVALFAAGQWVAAYKTKDAPEVGEGYCMTVGPFTKHTCCKA